MTKTALITGASGFVGSNLVKHLIAEGWNVHIIVRSETTLVQLLSVIDKVNVHLFNGHIASMRKIMRISKPHVVFHVASLVLGEHTPGDIKKIIDSNILFGALLVESMILEGIHRMVNTGTNWQHYEGKEYNPVNLYAASKQAFETLLEYYVQSCNLHVITLVLSDTYGLNDSRPKILNLLQKVAAENKPFIMSPGEQFIDLVHVEDVARAYEIAAKRLIERAVAKHEIYSVSSGKYIRLKDLVKMIEDVLGYSLQIVWGGRSYRDREVMTPWVGKILPDWVPLRKLFNETSLMFSSKPLNLRS